jgi:hypothetical protein
MSSPKTTRLEACQILYKGQSNVKLMANQLEISLEEMQQEFRDYVAKNPLDDDAWHKDIELSWPWQ